MAVLLACLPAGAGVGDTQTWDLPGSGNWFEPLNWSVQVPDATDDVAVFGPGLTDVFSVVSLGGQTATVGEVRHTGGGLLRLNFGDLDFDVSGAGGTARLMTGAGAGDLTLTTGVGFLDDDLEVDAAVGTRILLDGTIAAGSLGLSAVGGGELWLRGNNAGWAGAFEASGGEVFITNADALGTANTSVVSGAEVHLQAASAEAFDVQAGTLFVDTGGSAHTGAVTLSGGSLDTVLGGRLSGGLVLGAGAGGTVGASQGALLALTGGVSGAGDLVFAPEGTVRIEAVGPSHTGAVVVNTGRVELLAQAAHSGATTINGGLLLVSGAGSLVDSGGPVVVGPGGTLGIDRGAGSDSTQHSVALNGVVLNGGALMLQADLALASMLGTTSTSGALLLDSISAYSAGTTGLLDFKALPGGDALVLGAAGDSSLAATLQLAPGVSRTLRFGAGSGTLTISSVLTDGGGGPVQVSHAGAGTTRLAAANTYTGDTLVTGGLVEVAHAMGLGDTAGSTFVSAGGTLSLETPVAETIHLDGGLLLLTEAGLYSHPLEVQAGTLRADAAGVVTSNGPVGVMSQLTLLQTAAGGRLEFESEVAGAGQLVIGQGRVTLLGESTYTGLTTISGVSQVDVEHALALGSAGVGTVIQDSATVNLHTSSAETFTVSGGTLRLTDSGAVYTNPITLDGGTLRSQDDSGQVVLQMDAGLVVTADSSLVAADGFQLLGTLSGTGGLDITAFGDVVFADTVGLTGQVSLSVGRLVLGAPTAFGGLSVQNNARVEVQDGLAVDDTISLHDSAGLEWLGGTLSAEAFRISGRHDDVRLVLGTGVDLTALVDGTATGAALIMAGSSDDLPGMEVTNGALVRQTTGDLTAAGDLRVGTARGAGTLRLEGGSLSVGTVHVGSVGGSVLEITGGSLDTELRLGESPGTHGTLRIVSGAFTTADLSLGLGGTARVEHSGGTAGLQTLRFGEVAGPDAVYEVTNTGVLDVQALVFDEHAAGTLRAAGGTTTIADDFNTLYEGTGTAMLEVGGGTFNAGFVRLRAFPGRIAYHQTGGTANFSQALNIEFNADFQISGGTLNAQSLSIDGQPDPVMHIDGTIVADFFNLRAQTNNPLRYELSGGGIIVNENFNLTASATVPTPGTLTFVQTGGGVSAPNGFQIATNASLDNSTRYELAGGTLNTGSNPGLDVATFGDGGGNRAEFFQTGGIANFDELRLLNASVQIDAGTLIANTLDVSAGGPDIATIVEQNGGTVAIASLLDIGTARSNNVEARYRLTAGIFSADAADIGGDESLVLGNFEQSGGTATFGLLTVRSNGVYDLSGGTLAIRAGLVIDGSLDLHASAATVRAESGILDLATSPLLNATNANIVGLAGSVITLPAGLDPATAFGSFNNAGATHFQGDTLFIPVGPALVASGDFNDHIETRAGITASPFGAFSPLGGLRMIGAVDVDLGPTGRVEIPNTVSGMDGGTLTAQQMLVGTFVNNGPDARFVMDGGVIQLASIDDSPQQPGSLTVNARSGTESTLVLNDGQIIIDGENQSARFSVQATGGTAVVEQHGGAVILPGENGAFSVSGASSIGDARYIMTGGVLSVEDANFGGGADIQLLGGTMTLSRFASLRRTHDNPAALTVSGGTLVASTLRIEAQATERLTQFSVEDGLAQIGLLDSETATVLVSGGRLEADTIAITSENFGTDQFYSEFIQTGGVTAAATGVVVGDRNGSTLLRLSGGAFEAPVITLSSRGGLTTVELLSPGIRMLATDRLIIGEGTVLSAVEGATVHLDTASLEMESTSPANLAGLENLTLLAEGNLDIEVGGRDLGAVLSGFDNNFALRELVLGDDEVGLVRIVDETDNALGDTQDEALYVDRLVLGAGSGLNLNGLNVYYHQFIDLGGLVLTDGGALIHVPLNVLGDLSGDDYVGVEDLDILLANWGDSVTPGDLSLGDVSGDGLVDGVDLDIVINQWGQGIAPRDVPEPATAVTLLLGAFMIARRRRTVFCG